MTGNASDNNLREHEYLALYDALAANTKGRVFLRELIDRARPQDTRILLEALAKIETTLGSIREHLNPDQMADELRRIAGMVHGIVTAASHMPSEIVDADKFFLERTSLDALMRARDDLVVLANALRTKAASPAPSEPTKIAQEEPMEDGFLSDDLDLID